MLSGYMTVMHRRQVNTKPNCGSGGGGGGGDGMGAATALEASLGAAASQERPSTNLIGRSTAGSAARRAKKSARMVRRQRSSSTSQPGLKNFNFRHLFTGGGGGGLVMGCNYVPSFHFASAIAPNSLSGPFYYFLGGG